MKLSTKNNCDNFFSPETRWMVLFSFNEPSKCLPADELTCWNELAGLAWEPSSPGEGKKLN
jgi:hypothetical protein